MNDKVETKVFSVESANFHINKTNPPQLVVTAAGHVNSSGWSFGRLIPWIYVDRPADGIQDFDFVATAPTGIVLTVISPISGDGSIELQDWMTGIRVHSSTSRIEVLFEDISRVAEARHISEMGFPQPA